jgi:hypothetical protein
MVPRDLLTKAAALAAMFVAGLVLAVAGCGDEDGGGGVTTVTETVTTSGTTTNGTTTNDGTTAEDTTTEGTTTEDTTTTGETETETETD